MHNRRSDRWTLDKRVPVIPAILLLGQLCSVIWFGSKLDSRVTALEDKAKTTDPLIERVITMDATMKMMGKQLDSISDKLDKRFEKR